MYKLRGRGVIRWADTLRPQFAFRLIAVRTLRFRTADAFRPPEALRLLLLEFYEVQIKLSG